MKRLNILLIFIFLVQVKRTPGQNYIAKTNIIGIKDSGFYKLPLLPKYKAFAKQDLSNIRILNAGDKEIPYIIETEEDRELPNKVFVNFDPAIYHIQSGINQSTEVVIENNYLNKCNQFAFEIKNSEVLKQYQISGSDDRFNWYAISMNKSFGDFFSSGKNYKTVNFEPVSYRYYKINIDDSLHKPYKILGIGLMENAYLPGKLVSVAGIKSNISQDVQFKKTFIYFRNPYPVHIHQIQFKITGPVFFKRAANLFYYPGTEKTAIHHHRFGFVSGNDSLHTYIMPEFYSGNFYIEIENEDNQNLDIREIQCKQFATYLIADFKPSESYFLCYGDSSKQKPSYDLEYFKDKISLELPFLSLGEIIEPVKIISPEPKPAFWETKWFMWACIGFGGIIVLLFANNLLRDLKKG